jgi:transcriptional regulator with GAF, ATPase, and Fis domain
MRATYRQIEKLAPTDIKTLVQGENGTGKGLIAHALHLSGSRSHQPFVTLDCSTIPEGLIESHLFGHVRGAFTGAVATRRGASPRPTVAPCSSTRSPSSGLPCRRGSCA